MDRGSGIIVQSYVFFPAFFRKLSSFFRKTLAKEQKMRIMIRSIQFFTEFALSSAQPLREAVGTTFFGCLSAEQRGITLHFPSFPQRYPLFRRCEETTLPSSEFYPLPQSAAKLGGASHIWDLLFFMFLLDFTEVVVKYNFK
jgi:hypothetical protein